MENEGAKIRVTLRGAVVALALVALWVTMLAYGHSQPESLLGVLIRLPFGVPLLVFGSSLVIVPIERYFKRRGKPLFIRDHDG